MQNDRGNARRATISGLAIAVLAALGAGLALGTGASGQVPACLDQAGYTVPCPTPTATPTPTPTPVQTVVPAPPDTRPCGLTARALAGQRIRTLRSAGLRLRVTTDEACILTTRLSVDRRTARRLGINRRATRSVVVGSAVRSVVPGTSTVVVRLTSRARAATRRARSLALTVRASTRDAAGNLQTLGSRKVALRR